MTPREASGYLARVARRAISTWWRDILIDLEREPSGIASVVFEARALRVYDVAGVEPGQLAARLAEAGAKSAAFVPLISEGR